MLDFDDDALIYACLDANVDVLVDVDLLIDIDEDMLFDVHVDVSQHTLRMKKAIMLLR